MIHTEWNVLSDIQQLAEIEQASFEKPIVIFKHSTRCGISEMAKHLLNENWSFKNADFDFYYLDLLAHRDISNQIATWTKVVHQSPQVIIIYEGRAVSDFSHHRITAPVLKDQLAKLPALS